MFLDVTCLLLPIVTTLELADFCYWKQLVMVLPDATKRHSIYWLLLDATSIIVCHESLLDVTLLLIEVTVQFPANL